jgi:putative membrane protein
MEVKTEDISRYKKIISPEPILFLAGFSVFFGLIGQKMGAINLVNTMMNTASALLTDTVWYIMAIAVLAGALGALLTEFGVVALLNKILSPLIKPLYGMPGASMIGILTAFLSDNPAILTLADDKNFRRFFKKYQIPALANVGTAFGMGMIVITFMIGLSSLSGTNFVSAVVIGFLGAVVGSVISTRLMLLKTAKLFGKDEMADNGADFGNEALELRSIREGGVGKRFLEALLSGGKSGVRMGLGIIPGVLIICTIVMILTNGPGENGVYTGAAYEGISFLPWFADKLGFILEPLFGFAYDGAIAVPITALGSAGAALGLIPEMVEQGLIGGNEIAVFTAMCMCWSGYLSTHIAMMDELGCRQLTGHAILSHTIGGLAAGISAHLIYVCIM